MKTKKSQPYLNLFIGLCLTSFIACPGLAQQECGGPPAVGVGLSDQNAITTVTLEARNRDTSHYSSTKTIKGTDMVFFSDLPRCPVFGSVTITTKGTNKSAILRFVPDSKSPGYYSVVTQTCTYDKCCGGVSMVNNFYFDAGDASANICFQKK